MRKVVFYVGQDRQSARSILANKNSRMTKMRGYLIRVGIDSIPEDIGYCAPVFSDNAFEYIPIPQFDNASSETETYGTLRARNTQYGKVLADFMHKDRHTFLDEHGVPRMFSVIDENGEPLLAKNMTPHFDPEFVTNTYGDSPAEYGGRIPSDLGQGDCLFFYAGLSRYNADFCESQRSWNMLRDYQVRNKPTFLIGYLKVAEVLRVMNEQDLRSSREIWNNAHVKEGVVPTVVVKGSDESKLQKKAVQLNYWDGNIRKYCPTRVGIEIGLKPTTGMREMRWLNENLYKHLIRIMDEVDH